MKSLRRQFTLIMLAYGPGMLLLGFAILYFLVRSALYKQFDESLKTSAVMIAEEIHEDVDTMDGPSIQNELAEFEAHDIPTSYYDIVTTDGRTLARSPEIEAAYSEPYALSSMKDQGRVRDFHFEDGKPGRAFTLLFESSATPFLITLIKESEQLEETLDRVEFVVVLSGITMIVIALVVGPWFLRQALAPIGMIDRRISDIDVRTLSQRIPAETLPLELQQVAFRLNELLERLEVGFARERQVNADLAHELRTPIAELRILLETNLKWPESRDDMTDETLMGTVRHLEGMMDRMLILARSEAGLYTPKSENCPVDALVNSVCKAFERRVAERDLRIDLQCEPVSIPSDPVLLRAIVTNLMENATGYAPEGSTIRVRASLKTPDQCGIHIANPAPNLNQSDLSKIGDRYWRKDTSREGNHLGIGSAIITSLCQSIGADINYTLSEEQVFTATIILKAPGYRGN